MLYKNADFLAKTLFIVNWARGFEITGRALKIALLATIPLLLSCQTYQKADLRAFFPADTLMYMETQDLAGIGKVFTANKNWQALSNSGADYLPYLEKKQAVLGVTGLKNSEEGAALQIKPELVMAVDTERSDSEAQAISEKVTRELAAIFLKEEGTLERQEASVVFTSTSGKKMFSTTMGNVVLVSNSEEALKKCVEVRRNAQASLSTNPELTGALERHAAAEGSLAFGYVSEKGINEIAEYLGVTYAVNSSDSTFMRDLVSGTMPGFLQKTVRSVSWSARMTETGVEDMYLFKTDKQFADNIYQSIKPLPAVTTGNGHNLPKSVFSVTTYRLENPQIAWRGMVLSLAAQLDEKSLGLFQQFSGQLLKPYGIDQPEVFLSGVESPVVTARFDEDGNEAAVIAKVKDKEKIKTAIAETFDIAQTLLTIESGEILKSREGDFSVAFVGDTLILGNILAVERCLKAASGKDGDKATPAGFGGEGAIVSGRQKDDSAVQILSYVAAKGKTAVQVDSYAFSEIVIEHNGIRRRTISAFGLLGEMFKQTFE